MKRLLATTLAIALGAAPALAGDIYGSLYYDPNSGAWGASSSQSSPDVAELVALGNCEANNPSSSFCEQIATVEGVCVVLAVSPDGPWGFGVDDDDVIAENAAMDYCEANGGYDCAPEIRVCGDE